MSIPHDDPRLTAYALWELSPEESEALEARLQRDAAARAEVAAIRAAGAWLERELARHDAPALSARRRAIIVAAAAQDDASSLQVAPRGLAGARHPRRWLAFAALAAPAVLAVMMALTRRHQSSIAPERASAAPDPSARDWKQPAAEASEGREAPPTGSPAVASGPTGAGPTGAGPMVPPALVAPSPPTPMLEPSVPTSPEPVAGRAGEWSEDDAEGDDWGGEGGVVGGFVGGAAPPPMIRSQLDPAGAKRLSAQAGRSLLAIDPNAMPYKVDLPEEYVQRGEEYRATITICVTPSGAVSSVQILKPSIPIIDRQLPKVISLWKYRPYLVDGQPTSFCYSTNYRVVQGP